MFQVSFLLQNQTLRGVYYQGVCHLVIFGYNIKLTGSQGVFIQGAPGFSVTKDYVPEIRPVDTISSSQKSLVLNYKFI